MNPFTPSGCCLSGWRELSFPLLPRRPIGVALVRGPRPVYCIYAQTCTSPVDVTFIYIYIYYLEWNWVCICISCHLRRSQAVTSSRGQTRVRRWAQLIPGDGCNGRTEHFEGCLAPLQCQLRSLFFSIRLSFSIHLFRLLSFLFDSLIQRSKKNEGKINGKMYETSLQSRRWLKYRKGLFRD